MDISKIIKQLKVPKSAVYDAVRRYKELGNTKDRPKSGRPWSCRTKSNIKVIRERVRRDPLKLKKRQYLTVLQQRKRAERAGLLWNVLKSGTQKGKIVFSDETIFTV